MDQTHEAYIQKLRALQAHKIAEKTQPRRLRAEALEPIERFAQSLAEAGEIANVRLFDETFACAILVCSGMQNLLASGGSIHVTCLSAQHGRVQGHIFWKVNVEVLGRKSRQFSGSDDYSEVFYYLVHCIADQKANN